MASTNDNGRGEHRLARLYTADQAQIIMDDMPSDLSEAEVDSDPEDPMYEPELTMRSGSMRDDPLDVVSDNDAGTSGTGSHSQERRWKKTEAEIPEPQFDKPQGPKPTEFEGCVKPLDFFLKYFDGGIQDSILYQSNLYMVQSGKIGDPMTKEEFYGFLGVNMVMGYHVLPSYRMYWEQKDDVHVPIIANTMTRNRFTFLLGHLHVNDNLAGEGSGDKLWKLRPLIDALNTNFVKLYDVSRVQSIDESMVLFKGRSCLKQYCPMKPIKRGFKIWVRADPDGYISKFQVYQGKGTTSVEGFGLGEGVVLHLSENLEGHTIYFDNYFTSIPLLELLKSKNIHACGTIRVNRKGTPDALLKDKNMKRGEYDFRMSNTGVSFVKWMDNRAVHIASNFHGTNEARVDRTQKDGSKLELPCPISVKDYNAFMGGVDKADMLAAAYGVSRKSKKWWHRIFFGLVDRTIVNSFIAYKKKENKEKEPLLPFLREVAMGLITLSRPPRVGRPLSSPCPSPVPVKKRSGGIVPDSVRLTNIGVHHVVYVKERGRCRVCSERKIQSRPHSMCSMCNKYLCSNENKNCFNVYHGIQ